MRAVLERDFLREVSRGRSFLVRASVAGVLSAAILIVAAVEYDLLARNPDEMGEMLFITGSMALLGLLALWTPPMTVEAILEERQQGTLALVLAAPVHPAGLALGKILSRTGVVMTGALAAVPPLAVPLLLGGVSWGRVLALVVTVTAVVLELAAWSVFISSISKRLATAVVLAFVLPAARWTLWGFLLAWAEDRARGPVAANLVATCPIGPLLELGKPGVCLREFGGGSSLDAFSAFLLQQPWWGCLATAVLIAGVAALASARRLAREEEPFQFPWLRRGKPGSATSAPSRAPITAKGATAGPTARSRVSRLPRVPTLRRIFGHGRPGLNPVVWKEARQLNTSTSRPLYYTVLVILLFILGSSVWNGMRGNSTLSALAAEMTLLCLVGCVQGAAAFGHERSQGSYDLLRSAPMPPGDIALGKVVGGVVGLGFLAAVPLCHVILASITGTAPLLPLLLGLVLCSTLPVYWTVQGLSSSSNHAKVRPAMVRSLAAFGAALLLFPLIGGLSRSIGVLDRETADWLMAASPPATVHGTLDLMVDLSRGLSWNWEGNGEKAATWCVLMALGGLAHYGLMRFRLAARFEEDREE